MTREEVKASERFNMDPLAQRAHKMAGNILSMRYGYQDESNEIALRSAIDGIKATDFKVRFMDLLRAELLAQFQDHDKDCTNKNCRMGQIHAEASFIIQDELAALAPLVANRSATDSITAQQSSELIRIKNDILDAIQTAQRDSTTAFLIISEQVDELFGKQAYGKKDLLSLIKSRLVEVGVDKVLDEGIYEPLMTKVEVILTTGPTPP